MALMSGNGGDKASGNTVPLKDRYDIGLDQPLPQFDTPPAMAYQATLRRDNKRRLFALICDPKLPLRLAAMATMHRINHRNIMGVVDWGVIFWPPEGRRCPVLILEQPSGSPAFPTLDAEVPPMQEEQVIQRFVKPITNALRELHGAGLVHRAIRPDNIYFDETLGGEAVLGECISAPAGIAQPLAYETIQGGQCAPAGRGEGGPENDLYAVGVTLLALLSGRSPGQGVDEQLVLREKLVSGSYGALAQKLRVSLTMLEPLRGLLNDDPKERWGLEQLMLWSAGRRLSPKQQVLPAKGSRPFVFMGQSLATAREVAHAFAGNFDEALTPITDGAIDQWLRRSLSEDERVEAMNAAKAAGGDGDRIVSRALIALDPEGPIRLREFRANMDGLSTLLASHADDSRARQLFHQVITNGLIPFWLEMQQRTLPDQMRIVTKFERIRTVIDRNHHGFGFERAIYELNVEWPCISPLFERDCVPLLEYLLPALDRVAAQSEQPPKRLVDRHIAGFIATHIKRGIGSELSDLDNDQPAVQALAQIKLLAAVQGQGQIIELPNLCRVALTLLEPTIERFHGASRRKTLREKLSKAAATGKLSEVLSIVDNYQELTEDQRLFDRAVAEYADITNQLNKIAVDRRNLAALARDVGGQVASTISLLIAGVIGSGLLVYALL